MSVTEAKPNACKSKIEEKDAASKPCIDFQPGDRWQIKDDVNNDQQKNSPPKAKDTNHSNGRRSLRLRNSRSTDSTVVNGDASDCPSDDENKIKPNKVNNECDSNSAICDKPQPNSKRKRKLSTDETEKSADEPAKSTEEHVNSTDKLDKSDIESRQSDEPNELTEEPSNKKLKISEDEDSSSKLVNSKEMLIAEEDGKKVNQSELHQNHIDDEKSNSTDSINATSKSDSVEDSMDCETSTKSPRDLNTSIEILGEENEKYLASNNSEKDSTVKEDESKAKVKECIKINDSLDDDIEVININDDGKNDSDSEIQIITLEDTKKKVIDFPANSSSDVTLSAGYPYYNSLKEKLPDFKAGDYKPVKFPHTGTLLLAENEVIIESPSLLVPLLIKETDKFPTLEGEEKKVNGENLSMVKQSMVSKRNFFQSSVGQFLINLGMSRVNEWYHRDMKRTKLKQLKSKKCTEENLQADLATHEKRYSELKEINAIFNFRMKQCKFCGFKSESAVVMEGHYLTPHISPRREYKCNFCMFLSKTADAIIFHYEAIHQKKAIIESTVPFHECVFCSFQSHLKTKVTAHMNRCRKHFFPSQNLAPPFDFEFPGVTTKPVTIADVIGHRRLLMNSAKNRLPAPEDNPNSAYARKKLASVLSKLSSQNAYSDGKNASIVKQLMTPQSNLPPLSTNSIQLPPGIVITRPRGQPIQQMRPVGRFPQPRGVANIRAGPIPRRPFSPNLTAAASHLASSGISITPVTRPGVVTTRPNLPGVKNVTLTPISVNSNRNVAPRPGVPQPMALFTNVAGSSGMLGQPQAKLPVNLRPLRPAAPYQRLTTPPSQVVKGSSGNTFVVCEICDSYVKDLEELRTHMNWVHKVKIHPKMLVSRPPLNCQKCQWRFFTDQGLERHLLGAHGLVTTNMQEMANKNQDGGRCIICAAVFTYKLVSHMTQVHKVTLKPAHLSYKCTVCTATFTLYRLFESHVYNVHSGSSKRTTEESPAVEQPPPKKVASHVGPRKCKECGFVTENFQDHLIAKHMKKGRVKLCRIEKCKKCLYSSDEMLVIRMSDFGLDSDADDSEEDEEDENESSEESEDDKKSATKETG